MKTTANKPNENCEYIAHERALNESARHMSSDTSRSQPGGAAQEIPIHAV